MSNEIKSEKLLASFFCYCHEHPDLRFWQALQGWAMIPFLVASNRPVGDPWDRNMAHMADTFYWEEKNEFESKPSSKDRKN